jgi:hypothetical protein
LSLKTLIYALSRLPAPLHDELFEYVLERLDDDSIALASRIAALTLLAEDTSLPEKNELYIRSLALAKQITHYETRTDVFLRLSSQLPAPFNETALEDAWNSAYCVDDAYTRQDKMLAVLSHLSRDDKQSSIDPILSAIIEIKPEWQQIVPLLELSKHTEILQARELAETAVNLLSQSDVGTCSFFDFEQWAEYMLEIGEQKLAVQIAHEKSRFDGDEFAACTPQFMARLGLYDEALSFAREISEAAEQIKAYQNLIPILPASYKESLLTEILAFANEKCRVQVFVLLIPYLAERNDLRMLSMVSQLGSDKAFAEALAGLVPYLSEDAVVETLAQVLQLQDIQARAEAITALIPKVGSLQKHTMQSAVLELLPSIHIDEFLSHPSLSILGNIVSDLSDDLLMQALEIVTSWSSSQGAYKLLISHATNLPNVSLHLLLIKALHTSARQGSEALLGNIAALWPIVLKLGGEQVHRVFAESVLNCKEWWC